MVVNQNTSISNSTIIHENVTIEKGVVIHDYVVIYPNTIIRQGVEIWDHCVLGKPPTSPGCIDREFKSKYEPLIIGANSILCPHVILYTGITIGERTMLGDNCSIREECSIGNDCLIGRNVSVNYNTTIGDRTKIMDNSHITGNMAIGKNVFIGMGIVTSNDNNIGKMGFDEAYVQGPKIEDNVLIGTGANLLPNVRIGKGSIVGAGALVTRDVPPNKLVMGMPARIIRDL